MPRKRGQDRLTVEDSNTDLSGDRFGGCVSDQDIAGMNATGAQLVSFDAHRIKAGPAQIEERSQVDNRLDMILSRALKTGCVVPLI